ncbi:hypothetical protein ABGI61_13940 [Rheinheimera sp. FR7-31]|uniref:hypothetical protein n=1 Tax=Rheinheimera fenheensis TaxID=3152295 RepID=UPI00325DF0A6
MSAGVVLWIVFAVSAMLFRYVGKSFISQPDYNVPEIFRNPGIAKLLVILPQLGFASVIMLGFIITDNGWWYLGAVVVGVLILVPKPFKEPSSNENPVIDPTTKAVKSKLNNLFGDTSDLSEELVNSLSNIAYFSEKALNQNYGGLVDLKSMHPNNSESELFSIYMEHMAHVTASLNSAPKLIENLRSMRAKDPELFSYFEEVTVDILKYKIDDVGNKNEIRRFAERKTKKPIEYEGLARKFGIPFRT